MKFMLIILITIANRFGRPINLNRAKL